MKKVVLILLSLFFITACENEPLDPALQTENPIPDPNPNPNPNPQPGSESDDLTLQVYELDTDITLSFFGFPIQTITNSDLNISNNLLTNGTTSISVEGSPFVTENQVITRNSSGQIVSDISTNAAGTVTNETLVTYDNNNVATITYDYFEDDTDDFDYSFVYSGNTITRSEAGSNITTVFTLDSSNRVIQKESFDGEFSIQNEIVNYDANGNITSGIITGELEQNSTFVFDSNTNPLKLVYSDNYILRFLGDEYSDEIGASIAQFHSTNNWSGTTIDGNTFTFDLTYNSVGRIETREIQIDIPDLLLSRINESFRYVN